MTSDVIDTAPRARQAGAMTNIGHVVQVVQVEPLVLAASPVAATPAAVTEPVAVPVEAPVEAPALAVT